MPDAWRWLPGAFRRHCGQRVVWVWFMVMVMVLVQTVGVLHRVAHAQQSLGVASHAAIHKAETLATLWGEHRTSAECQLFDQACPDLLHEPVLTWSPALVVTGWVAASWTEHYALSERFNAARGPPVWH